MSKHYSDLGTQPVLSVKLYQKLTVLWGSGVKIVFPKIAFLTIGSLMLAACSPADSNGAAQTNDAQSVTAGVDEAKAVEPVVARVVFPESFRGNWDYNENGCGEGESGTKFRITDKAIVGYEDTSILKSIDVVDDLTIRVVLDNESAEGTETLRQTMRLSPVAGISMRIEQNGETIRTLRCDPV